MERGQSPLRDDLRAGCRARRRDDRPFPRARARSDPRHRAARCGCSRPRSAPGCGCCAIGGRCRSPKSWRRRSPTRRTATRWSSAISETISVMARCSVANGRVRPRSICRRASRRRRAGCFAIRRSPRPIAGCLPKPATGPAKARSSAPAPRGIAGFVAEAIDRFCRHEKVLDSSGRRHGGLLTGDDLARWEAPVEAPVTFDYRDWTVMQGWAVEPGSGAAADLGAAAGVRSRRSRSARAGFRPHRRRMLKLAFADREAWYGDPDFVDVPMRTLLSPPTTMRGASWSATARRWSCAPADRTAACPGCWSAGAKPRSPAPALASRRSPGSASRRSTRQGVVAGDTCHVDVVDRWGNMVSATPSGGWLQSSPVIPELGFCLGTRMQMFWLEEGLPASLEPGKRPRSTLSPSMAFKDGEPYTGFRHPRRRSAGPMVGADVGASRRSPA